MDDIFLDAVLHYPDAIINIPEHLRTDKLWKISIHYFPSNIPRLPEHIFDDPEIRDFVFEKNICNIRYIPWKFRTINMWKKVLNYVYSDYQPIFLDIKYHLEKHNILPQEIWELVIHKWIEFIDITPKEYISNSMLLDLVKCYNKMDPTTFNYRLKLFPKEYFTSKNISDIYNSIGVNDSFTDITLLFKYIDDDK